MTITTGRRITDIDADDWRRRVDLIRQLTNIRINRGLTRTDVARHLGCHPNVVRLAETRGTNPTVRVVQRYAAAYAHRLTPTIVGLPDQSANPEVVALYAVADAATTQEMADAYDRAALLALLAATRRAAGVPQEKLGLAMGGSLASVSHIESGRKETLVSTAQRYVRALGGVLLFDLTPVNELERT